MEDDILYSPIMTKPERVHVLRDEIHDVVPGDKVSMTAQVGQKGKVRFRIEFIEFDEE